MPMNHSSLTGLANQSKWGPAVVFDGVDSIGQRPSAVLQAMPEIGNPDAVASVNWLRSHHSRQSSFVTFCNCTGRSVQPVWINYRGLPETYAVMAAQSGRKMNTFTGHPWMFRDANSDDRLLVNGHEVFFTPPGQVNEIGQPQYIIVKITIPVYTLKERCLQVVRSLVKREDYRHLEIVRSLHDELEDHPQVLKDLQRLQQLAKQEGKSHNSE